MFIVKCENPNDWAKALFILGFYHVKPEVFCNGETTDGMYMVVDGPVAVSEDSTMEDPVGMAELAFQCPPDNWHTESHSLCEVCKQDEVDVCVDCDIRYNCDDQRDECGLKHQPRTCGHLTFTKPIKSAF